jgi:hypothetical protein
MARGGHGLCMTLPNKACLDQLYCSCIIDTNIIHDLRILIVSNCLELVCFVQLQVNWLLDGKHPVCPGSCTEGRFAEKRLFAVDFITEFLRTQDRGYAALALIRKRLSGVSNLITPSEYSHSSSDKIAQNYSHILQASSSSLTPLYLLR